MIHVLASLPFWLIGIATGVIGVTGWLSTFCKALYTEVSPENTRTAIQSACLLTLVSGVSLTIAAWLCS
jgi:hypothetical protein